MSITKAKRIDEAIEVLKHIGLPPAQQNKRSALTLLALLNLTSKKNWDSSEKPLMGITPIMDWMAEHYSQKYKPNTRETIRRDSMHQFVQAGIALYNPDKPDRPVNSPDAVYQISPEALCLFKNFGTPEWDDLLKIFLSNCTTLSKKYAKPRDMKQIPVQLSEGQVIQISPGKHSVLIKSIVEDFASRFIHEAILLYVGDTGKKWGYYDKCKMLELGITVDAHGKMPDVVFYYPSKNWLILVEAVTSHGPVDGKRHEELEQLFSKSKVGIVYVTAFPSRELMSKYIVEIAWETDVWVADAPTHMIHFNGSRFLGPYQ